MHYFEVDAASLPADPETRVTAVGRITADTLARAEQIAAWHLNEYKELFSPQRQPAPEDVDADKVYAYLHRTFHSRGIGTVLKNHVRQYSGVRNSTRLDAALRTLAGRLAISTGYGTGKKPPELIVLNLQYFNCYPVS
jgi:hypothetical protein